MSLLPPRSARRNRLARIGALLAAVALPLAACSSSPSSSGGSSTSGSTTIRFALDWTPNTNHSGLYVAIAEGYFADAGLNVEVVPYNSSSPDTLVGAGQADFGISFQSSATMSRAAGNPVTSVFAVLQHTATAIGVNASRTDITSPADLDGKTYAGFGGVDEEARMRQVIKDAGGTGDFTSVTLGTTAYEAVYSGQADFTEPFVAWEGIEATKAGTPFKYFKYTDYGFPDTYNVIVIGNDDWLAAHPTEAKAFVGALQKGYQLAADDPATAAKDLIAQNPGTFSDEDLVTESMKMLASDYMLDANGKVGTQTEAQWSGYGEFLYSAGILVDAQGATLTTEPDWSSYFTDKYLASE